MESKSEFLEIVGGIALIALFVIALYLVLLRPVSVNECVAGGYATYRRVKGDYLCLGVVEGEWKIEPRLDVRARLEEK